MRYFIARPSFEYPEEEVASNVLFSRLFSKYLLSKTSLLRICIRRIILLSTHTIFTVVRDSQLLGSAR